MAMIDFEKTELKNFAAPSCLLPLYLGNIWDEGQRDMTAATPFIIPVACEITA
jgi:hypothetical protein